MADAVLQVTIRAFVDQIQAAKSEDDIVALATSERQRIIADRTQATAKLYLHRYRQALKERLGEDHPAIAIMTGAGLRTKQPVRTELPFGVALDQMGGELRAAGDDHAAITAAAEKVKQNILARTPSTAHKYLILARQFVAAEFGEDHAALALLSGAGLNLHKKAQEARWLGDAAPTTSGAPPSGVAPRADTTTAAERLEQNALFQTRGRKPTLQARMAAFVDAVRKCRTEKEATDLWAKECAHYSHLAATTRVNYAAQYRAELRKALGENTPLLSIVAADLALATKVQESYAARVAERHARLVAIPKWREIIDRSRELLQADSSLLAALGLFATTGRRPVEIFTSARFERALLPGGTGGKGKAYSRFSVIFSGQGKTRGQDGTRFGEGYEIPVLAPAQEVIAALAKVRSAHPERGMTAKEFNTSKLYREAVLETFSNTFLDLWPMGVDLTPYQFRALYAEAAYKEFSSQAVSKNSFFSLVLGHTAKDLETSHSYLRFFLPTDEFSEAEFQTAQRRANRLAERAGERLRAIGRLPDAP